MVGAENTWTINTGIKYLVADLKEMVK